MQARDTVICTVGTSLLSNLRAAPASPPPNWSVIQSDFHGTEWRRLGRELAKLDPRDRLCGAEINTLEEVRAKPWVRPARLVFLVSDTEDGRAMETVLKEYFQARRDLAVQVDSVVVEGLQDERPNEFKTHGLRNLVRAIGEQVAKFGADHVVIDATGGYKAQIAVAVIMGQVLNIPVLYKHERFSTIIDFPPLPVAFDYDFLGAQADLLVAFEGGAMLTAADMGDLDEKLRVLLTEVEVDGEPVYELGPIGQIYLTGYRLRAGREAPSLTPASTRKAPTFGKHHYPPGFQEFVQKVWSENAWVQTIHTLPYGGQARIRKGIGFRVEQVEGVPAVVGSFKPDDFGARFRVRLEDERPPTLVEATVRLNDRYQQ
jgi:putative CRISPR-associated protein (TIGR02619 family)